MNVHQKIKPESNSVDEALVKAIAERFRGYDRAHGQYKLTGTKDERGKAEGKALTLEGGPSLELWRLHLEGRLGLGVIPLEAPDTVWWLVIDADVYPLDHEALEKKIKALGLPLVMCRSKSAGAHLFVFFKVATSATLALAVAERYAALLGFAGCEIFPKQTTRKDDSEPGNWLNMPYFNCDATERYAIKGGQRLTLAQFLEYATDQATTLDDLPEIEAPESELFADGPPCLRMLEKLGIPSGNRNEGMFNVAVYLRKRFPDEWQNQVQEYNAKICDPQLSLSEVNALIKSVDRKKYSYKCKHPPIKRHCDKAACRQCAFGAFGLDDGTKVDVGVSVDDFVAYMVEHSYIYRPTGDPWPTPSVNSRLAKRDNLPANVWLDRHHHVEQMTWAPGKPELIRDTLFADGAWIPKPGVTVYNRYRPAVVKRQEGDATTWLNLGAEIFDDHFQHMVNWFAWRVQKPDVKINHALLLGGEQGIGKDTILEPVRRAIGEWNFKEQSPKYVLESQFNGYLQSVILRIRETRNLGENFDRFAFYESTKTMIAAPPETLTCNDKYTKAYPIVNANGVILTTNRKANGFFLPQNDRRHFVAWSERKRADFPDTYWDEIWGWYNGGGYEIVADYLWTVDLTKWNPKAPPPQTAAFWEIVHATASSEDAELADVLDAMGRPDVTTLADVAAATGETEFGEFLRDRRNARRVPHRFEQCDYVPVRNADAKDGLFKIGGRRMVVYGKNELTERQRVTAAQALAASGHVPPSRPASDCKKITVDLVCIHNTAGSEKATGDGASKYGDPETYMVIWLPNACHDVVTDPPGIREGCCRVTIDEWLWNKKQAEWKPADDRDRDAINLALGEDVDDVPF
jgi:Family of unknown function (DUF5906)/TOTE conflict system, Archaeo-Eukaryotic Primase domain/Primase C terminal 1 (PriCT-1)